MSQDSHLSVKTQQRHVVCWLWLKEAVIPESEHVGEVWMEKDLGGVISLDGVILGWTQQIVLAEDNLNIFITLELLGAPRPFFLGFRFAQRF